MGFGCVAGQFCYGVVPVHWVKTGRVVGEVATCRGDGDARLAIGHSSSELPQWMGHGHRGLVRPPASSEDALGQEENSGERQHSEIN